MIKNKKIYSVLSVSAASALFLAAVSAPITAQAKTGDLYKDGKVAYSVDGYSHDMSQRRAIGAALAGHTTEYKYEIDENVYKFDDVNAKATSGKSLSEIYSDVKADSSLEKEPVSKELTVSSVSAINDLKSKEATITGKVVKPEDLKGSIKAEITVNSIDDKKVALPTKSLKLEDGAFKEVIDTKDYEAGKYEVVITATVGEETSEAKVEFTIDKAELEAIDAVVKAVNDAVNQLQLEEALGAPEFEGVNSDLLIEYDTALADITFETVKDIQDIIDGVNDGQNETAQVKAIVDAVKANDQKALLTALNDAKLEVAGEKEGEKVTVVVNAENLADYTTAINTSETVSAGSKIAGKLDNVAIVVDRVNQIKEALKAKDLNVTEVKDKTDDLKDELVKDLVTNDPATAIEAVETAVKTYEDAVVAANKSIVKYNAAVASAEDYKEYTKAGDLNSEGAVNKVLAAGVTAKTSLDTALKPANNAAKTTSTITTKTSELVTAVGAENETKGSRTGILGAVQTAKETVEADKAKEEAVARYKAVAKRADAIKLPKNTENSAYIAAVVAYTDGLPSDVKALNTALDALEEIVNLNEGIEAKDAAKVEKALIALKVNYKESTLYADLAKENRVELAEEFIETTEALVEKADVADLATVYETYSNKIKAVNEATKNSTMKTALEAIVGEGKVTLEQAEAFIANFPMDDATPAAKVKYTTLAAIEAAIK